EIPLAHAAVREGKVGPKRLGLAARRDPAVDDVARQAPESLLADQPRRVLGPRVGSGRVLFLARAFDDLAIVALEVRDDRLGLARIKCERRHADREPGSGWGGLAADRVVEEFRAKLVADRRKIRRGERAFEPGEGRIVAEES